MDVSFKSVSHNSANGYPQSRKDLEGSLAEFGIFLKEDDIGRDIGLCYGYPHNIKFLEKWGCKKKVVFTMFESTRIPDDWHEPLKKADKIIVPGQFCRQALNDAGFEAEIIPLGYNDKFFRYYKRPRRDVFTFLHYDAYGFRKGWDITFRAFTKAFDPDEPVRLIFKTVFPERLPPMGEYKNIEFIYDVTPRERLQMDWLNKADCMVFPSRGEGFGHTPLEAMATGLPVMIPDGSGMSEYFDHKRFIELNYKPCDALYDHYPKEQTGKMIECDADYLARVMRETYRLWKEDPDRIDQWTRENAAWVQKNWTYKQTAYKLNKLLCGL